MKIVTPSDCGNSPRKQLIIDFNIAFAKNNVDFIMEHLHEDIEWEMVGAYTLRGKESTTEFLKNIAEMQRESHTLQTVITHGKHASANGTITLVGDKTVAFCDVYHFSDNKNPIIKKIQSYSIEL